MERKYKECQMYIIENNEEEIKKFHAIGWCRDNVEVEEIHIKALLEGKAVGWSDGESTHVLTLKAIESESYNND